MKQKIEELELAQKAALLADEKLGEDIVILDVRELTSYTSFLVITNGKNERQVKAIGDYIVSEIRNSHAVKPLSVEGQQAAEWLLVDYGDVIIHVFSIDARFKYDLEGFWNDAKRIPLPITPQRTGT